MVESLPISEPIKLGEGDLEPLFDNYRQSLRNLAACGVTTVCYNFMPVLDWTRTELAHPLPGGARALRFNAHEYAAFDCFMLERPGAEDEHDPAVLARAKAWFDKASEDDKRQLLSNIMAGLPGAFDRYDAPGLRRMLDRYKGMTRETLRENLARFLREVIPTAEEAGIRMCIHPDDPPRPLLGLPRIVSNADDLAFIVEAVAIGRQRPDVLHRIARVPASITTYRPWRSASPGTSSSPICGTSPRSRTAPSWKPTTSAATSIWFPSSRPCWKSRSAAMMPEIPTGASRSGPITAMNCWTMWAKRPTRLPGHRPAARSGRNPRHHDRRRQPAAIAGLNPNKTRSRKREE